MALVSCIDVEHRADGVSLTLASQEFELSVKLSQSEADKLIEKLTEQPPEPAGSGSDAEAGCQPAAELTRGSTRVGC